MPGQLAGCGGQVTGVSTRRGQLVELARVITASPALLTREQQIFARLTDSLAQLIAEDTGGASGAVEPWMAANAHMGAPKPTAPSAWSSMGRPRPRPARLKAYAVRV